MEEWKAIPGYEGLYEVSDLGRVRSYYTEKVIKPSDNGYGYYQVQLCKKGNRKTLKVHRLVYEAFNGPIPEGLVADHVDGDKTNNKLSNLRCVTPKENNWNPVTRPRHIEALRNKSQEWRKKNTEAVRKANNKPIAQINKQTGEIIKLWECARDVERELGICNSNISACCNGKLKSTGGFKWKFCSK